MLSWVESGDISCARRGHLERVLCENGTDQSERSDQSDIDRRPQSEDKQRRIPDTKKMMGVGYTLGCESSPGDVERTEHPILSFLARRKKKSLVPVLLPDRLTTSDGQIVRQMKRCEVRVADLLRGVAHVRVRSASSGAARGNFATSGIFGQFFTKLLSCYARHSSDWERADSR